MNDGITTGTAVVTTAAEVSLLPLGLFICGMIVLVCVVLLFKNKATVR